MSETLEESSDPSSSTEDDWCALYDSDLPVEESLKWANHPSCGAVVLFTGNARDHAHERPNVNELAFEAYREQALPKMQEIINQARLQRPEVKRLALYTEQGK